MKNLYLSLVCCVWSICTYAQLDLPSAGSNPRATVTEEVGITNITLRYSRPDVSGREGKIWGNLVPYGFNTNNFITTKNTSPWRAGANDNTTITVEHDVKVEGKPLKAGTYGIHMAVWPDSVLLIFSNQSEAWGSFYYEQKYDALRTIVKPQTIDKSVEWLKYEFIEHKPTSATIALMWERLIIPFKIDVDVDNIVLARLREQVTSQKGFNAINMLQAAQFCLNKNINLEEALVWSQRAAGTRTFQSLNNLATAYFKLNKIAPSDSVMNEALEMANANQYTGYTRTLIGQKRLDKAIEHSKMSKTKYGETQQVELAIAYAYSAKGDFIHALEAANKALALAPNDVAKKNIQGLIDKLKDNKDIN